MSNDGSLGNGVDDKQRVLSNIRRASCHDDQTDYTFTSEVDMVAATTMNVIGILKFTIFNNKAENKLVKLDIMFSLC